MPDRDENSGTSVSEPFEKVRDGLMDLLPSVLKMVMSKVTDIVSSEDGGGSAIEKAASRALKGENPVKAFVGEKAKDAGEKVADKAKEAVGEGGSEAGDLKAVNIIEHIDVGIPLSQVYNQWTQLRDFSNFTNGVSSVSVDDEDETQSDWKVRVWPSTRSWKATVLEQVPDERIVWTSEGSMGTTHGCVSFHKLADRLTRVVVVVEYYPSGFFEKLGNIWRAQGRRLRLDLKHFQRYVTLQADVEDAEGWRGEIRDSEVVRSHDEVVEAEEEAEKRRKERRKARAKARSKKAEKHRDEEENHDEEED